MQLSVVVPTYRRPAFLRRCVESLVHQTLSSDEYEVVVVDDGSGDGTADLLTRLAADHAMVAPVVQEHNAGPAAARNRGLQAATGDLVLFVDDDVAAAPDLLWTHLRLHEQRNDPMLGVLGRVDWHPELRVTRFMRWLDRSGLQFGYDTWLREGLIEPPYLAFYTANISLRRSLVTDAGGFDERFPHAAYEDMELAWRLAQQGFRLEYAPAAQAFHLRTMDLSSYRERMTKVAASLGVLREAAPDFVIDDKALRKPDGRRRAELKTRLLSWFPGSRRTRQRRYSDYCWTSIARAYRS